MVLMGASKPCERRYNVISPTQQQQRFLIGPRLQQRVIVTNPEIVLLFLCLGRCPKPFYLHELKLQLLYVLEFLVYLLLL